MSCASRITARDAVAGGFGACGNLPAMENDQKLVSSRGLLRSCDIHNREPRSSSPEIEFSSEHKAGGSIYCCTDALENFANHVIDSISIPFVLVSGDSDTVVSPQSLGRPVFEKIASHPTLLRWHAQNLGAGHERLNFLPIGLDYHTLWEHPGVLGSAKRVSPFEQERALLRIKGGSPAAEQRMPLLYCDWQHSLNRPGRVDSPNRRARVDCLEQIDKSECHFEPAFLPREQNWERQANFAFVLCPEGNGPDTHRLWEALVLGCVPVVKRNFLSEFLADLPVLVADDWRQISTRYLRDSLESLQGRKFNYAKTFLEYWRREIRGGAREEIPAMSLRQYLAAV